MRRRGVTLIGISIEGRCTDPPIGDRRGQDTEFIDEAGGEHSPLMWPPFEHQRTDTKACAEFVERQREVRIALAGEEIRHSAIARKARYSSDTRSERTATTWSPSMLFLPCKPWIGVLPLRLTRDYRVRRNRRVARQRTHGVRRHPTSYPGKRLHRDATAHPRPLPYELWICSYSWRTAGLSGQRSVTMRPSIDVAMWQITRGRIVPVSSRRSGDSGWRP